MMSTASLLNYYTYKIVVISDKRLGAIYYFVALLILLYTFGEVFVQKGYLEFDLSPKGSLRLQLSNPKDRNNLIGLPEYCCGPADSESKKCSDCKFLDSQELSWPIESHTISLMTFGKDRWQANEQNGTSLPDFLNLREKNYFTITPEKMLLKIEHAVVATRFLQNGGKKNLAASQRSMKGCLYNAEKKMIKSLSSNDQDPLSHGRVDKLSVEELLYAAGVHSLEESSDALNAKGKSYRRHGMVLHVFINYHNSEGLWFGTGEMEYSYHVQRIPYADYRVNQLIPFVSAEEFNISVDEPSSHMETRRLRLLRKRYGIKIEFYQSGKLGSFSLSSLLLKLVSAVGLLTLTATIVDLLALYVLPDRTKYQKYMYEDAVQCRLPVAEEKTKQE